MDLDKTLGIPYLEEIDDLTWNKQFLGRIHHKT